MENTVEQRHGGVYGIGEKAQAVHSLQRQALGGKEPHMVRAGEVCPPEHFKLSFRIDSIYRNMLSKQVTHLSLCFTYGLYTEKGSKVFSSVGLFA